MRKALFALLVLASIGALTAAPAGAEDVQFGCGYVHGDPAPGYSGPLPVGLDCFQPGEYTWTVPEEAATTTRFFIDGADDAGKEAAGGHVDARLYLIPGSELTLEVGDEGEASAIRLGEEQLIVAGGGGGVEPNFVTPSAFEVKTEEPGAPATGWRDGRITVEWTYWYEGEDPLDPPQPEDPPRPGNPPTSPKAQPTCVIPRLKGLRPIAARKVLAHAGCAFGKVTRNPTPRHRRGRIIRQALAPGTRLPLGAVVDVVVGRRP
jgi:hypothetical protein